MSTGRVVNHWNKIGGEGNIALHVKFQLLILVIVYCSVLKEINSKFFMDNKVKASHTYVPWILGYYKSQICALFLIQSELLYTLVMNCNFKLYPVV